MDSESIEWVSYNKLSPLSDAFIYCESFNPLVKYKTGTPVSAEDLHNEKYTAGSTDNPEDYNLPDIKPIVKPERLGRINPFYNANSNKIKLLEYDKQNSEFVYPVSGDKKEETEQDFEFDIHTSPEAKKMLLFLSKQNKIEKKEDSYEIIFDDTEFEEFELDLEARYHEEKNPGIPETLSSVLADYSPIKKVNYDNSKKTEIINQNTINNNQNNFNNQTI